MIKRFLKRLVLHHRQFEKYYFRDSAFLIFISIAVSFGDLKQFIICPDKGKCLSHCSLPFAI